MTVTAITDHALPALRIVSAHSEAMVHLLGATVTHWQPHDQRPVLWVSPTSLYRDGSPIRGGMPVCGPWFGPHALDSRLPAHGLLRQRMWSHVGSETLADGAVQVRLCLVADAAMLALWPHPFVATLTVTVGHDLTVELAIHNTGTTPFLLAEALHTYLAVGDVRHIRITGLDGATYLDKMEGGARKRQGPEPITFSGQTDRVYLSDEPAAVIEDPHLSRSISVRKRGSGATVVWNPWAEKAATFTDFPPDAWPGMVCVESANAADATVAVPPEFSHHLTTIIGVAVSI